MDGHGLPEEIEKATRIAKRAVGGDLGKNLARNVGRLADSGSDYLIRQMDGHGLPEEIEKATRIAKRAVGGEVGDGLYAQGRGLKKGSAEAKAHMAKIRSMKGKGMKGYAKREILSDSNYGGAIPQPPSRSPVTRLRDA